MFIISETFAFGLLLSIIAIGAFNLSANFLALVTLPKSGDTTTTSSWSLNPFSTKLFANIGEPNKWSTGILKYPCIWEACKSIVNTLSAPEAVKISATNFAVIGSLDFAFLSCLAYP